MTLQEVNAQLLKCDGLRFSRKAWGGRAYLYARAIREPRFFGQGKPINLDVFLSVDGVGYAYRVTFEDAIAEDWELED